MKFLKKLKYVITLGVITVSCSVMASPYGDSDVLFGCIIKGKTTKEVAGLAPIFPDTEPVHKFV